MSNAVESMPNNACPVKYKTCRRLRRGMSREDALEMRREQHHRVGVRNDEANTDGADDRAARLAKTKLAEEKAKIEEILRRLIQDKSRWHFRRALFMSKIVSKNLLPTLTSVKEDKGILVATVKVLQEVMTPVECLMPIQIMSKNVEGFRIITELENSISSTKKLFLDGKATKALVDIMSSLLQDSKTLTIAECELMNHCLLLVRNLLHVSSVPSVLNLNGSFSSGKSTSTATRKGETEEENCGIVTEDQIMWNLFAHRFDNVIIQLLTCDQQHLWNITMVQLISLMYREQQQTSIRKLINDWLELSLAESSEDDEKNPMTSSSSDTVSTSDPVSDSSERLSPVEMANEINTQNIISAINNLTNTRLRKADKEDSCRDSGFGRSGSNQDSSQDDSVSEGALKNQTFSKSPRHSNPLLGKILGISFKELACDEKCLGECDVIKKEESKADRSGSGSGSEGGSENSSSSSRPIPILQRVSSLSLLDNDRGNSYVPPFTHDYQRELQPDALLDGNGDHISPLQEDHTEMVPVVVVKKESLVQNVSSSQNQLKRPSKEDEESGSSGDSSAKPIPQLPKCHKPLTGQKRSRHALLQQMLSETQENNESSNSTGSECDEGPQAKRPHHQKPHKMLSKPRPAKMLQQALQEENIKRNKLLRRKDITGIKAKALLHHHPTPDDISNLLKEFTIDFVLNGFSNLVEGLRLKVMIPYQIDLDKSHLLWLITYFMRFAVELDLELAQISPILSVDVISYLVYEGVLVHEELESALRAGETNVRAHVRHLHLVVTALREFFVALDICLKKDHSLIDIKHVLSIKEELGRLVEVRQLFVLLIRTYHPEVLNLNYLQDLIITNHRFLTTQEATSEVYPSMPSFNIVNHVKQFATMDLMRQYSYLLENFNINDETVNDCIFTMMHHVAGDLQNVNVLLEPCILRIFLRIWKEGFELCVDWVDLIEYILRKCTRVRTENPDGRENLMFPKPLAEPAAIELINDDFDQLYTRYKSSSSEQDLMDKIHDICCDDSIEEPIKKEMEPMAAKSEGTTSLEIDVMQVSSDSEDSCDGLNLSMPESLEEKKREFYNCSSSDDFKMLPPELPKDIPVVIKEHDQEGMKNLETLKSSPYFIVTPPQTESAIVPWKTTDQIHRPHCPI